MEKQNDRVCLRAQRFALHSGRRACEPIARSLQRSEGPCTSKYARRHAHGSQTGRSARMLLVQKLKGCPQTSDPMTHYPRVLDSEVSKGVMAEILESVLLHSGSVLACG